MKIHLQKKHSQTNFNFFRKKYSEPLNKRTSRYAHEGPAGTFLLRAGTAIKGRPVRFLLRAGVKTLQFLKVFEHFGVVSISSIMLANALCQARHQPVRFIKGRPVRVH